MGKLNILYKEDSKSLIDYVYLSIDKGDYRKLHKSKIESIELENGNHNIRITSNTISEIRKEENVGTAQVTAKEQVWIDEEIIMNSKEQYCVLYAPIIVTHKGKLKKVSKEQFEKIIKKSKFWNSKLGVVIVLIILGILSMILDLF